MVQPVSILNQRGQSIITLYHPDGTELVQLAIGNKAVSGFDDNGAWAGVATHAEGDTFAAGDGAMVLAGLDETDGETVRPTLVDAAGRLLVATVPGSGNLTDRSDTLAVAATSEQVMAANTNRKYLLIQNVHASEAMWINFGTAAVQSQPSIYIPPLGGFEWGGSFVPTQALHVIATTVAHPWTAKEA